MDELLAEVCKRWNAPVSFPAELPLFGSKDCKVILRPLLLFSKESNA
ncbi:hypothetical protein [Paenibacillus polymyxa]|nr:hypothetical protein [Paenibacillus polymyxa]